jgi:uncharacterized protein (TIGR02246 family)
MIIVKRNRLASGSWPNERPIVTDDVQQRLARLESRIEIMEMITRYSIAVDDRDLDTVADLFTSDASFSSVGGHPSGREELKAYYAARLERYGATYHYPHSQLVEFLSDDEATGVVLAHAELSIDGATFVVAMRYVDAYRREGGRWRFAQRRLDTIYALPLAELPTGLADELRKRWPGNEAQPAELPEGQATWQAFLAER